MKSDEELKKEFMEYVRKLNKWQDEAYENMGDVIKK